MYHRSMRLVQVLFFCGLAGAAPAHSPYRQMFVFGDSYSDLGEGYLDGNGPTAVAYLAKALGFDLLPSNQRAPASASLDFAISGAQTGSSTGEKTDGALLGFGMRNQVDDFAGRVKSGKIRFEPATSLFFIAGGLNDQKLPTMTTVNNLEGEIRALYALGGRHFALALMPIAIPAFRTVGLRLNPALEKIPGQMKAELPGAEIVLSRWGPFFDQVIRNPAVYGIKNTTDACAGREIFHESPKPCADPASYFYYHGGHPSTAVHEIVGGKLAAELRR